MMRMYKSLLAVSVTALLMSCGSSSNHYIDGTIKDPIDPPNGPNESNPSASEYFISLKDSDLTDIEGKGVVLNLKDSKGNNFSYTLKGIGTHLETTGNDGLAALHSATKFDNGISGINGVIKKGGEYIPFVIANFDDPSKSATFNSNPTQGLVHYTANATGSGPNGLETGMAYMTMDFQNASFLGGIQLPNGETHVGFGGHSSVVNPETGRGGIFDNKFEGIAYHDVADSYVPFFGIFTDGKKGVSGIYGKGGDAFNGSFFGSSVDKLPPGLVPSFPDVDQK